MPICLEVDQEDEGLVGVLVEDSRSFGAAVAVLWVPVDLLSEKTLRRVAEYSHLVQKLHQRINIKTPQRP